MSRRRIPAIILLCIMLLSTTQTALAQTGGEINGSKANNGGGTSVYAGVAVDYMGKVRFSVSEKKTGEPVPGVSFEIWLPRQNRYVLCGVTDEDGVLELDMIYEVGRDAEFGIKVPDSFNSQIPAETFSESLSEEEPQALSGTESQEPPDVSLRSLPDEELATPPDADPQAQPFAIRSNTAAPFMIRSREVSTISNEDSPVVRQETILSGESGDSSAVSREASGGGKKGQKEEEVVRGSMVFLPENTISYRCYKWGYRPYPYRGKLVLGLETIPRKIEISLLQKDINGAGGPGGTGVNNIPGSVVQNEAPLSTMSDMPELFPVDDSEGLETGVIPKTGVEGTMHYWLIALACFLIAGMILFFILRSDRGAKKDNGIDKDTYHDREER